MNVAAGAYPRNPLGHQLSLEGARATLLPINRRKVAPESVVYSNTFASYDAPSVDGYEHVRFYHSAELADGTRHINGIENFWS